jgi:hypothetical protein
MMGKAAPLEERVRSASRCAMGVRGRGVTAELGAIRHLISRGDSHCVRSARAGSLTLGFPQDSRVEEWCGSLALARELAALGYLTMAESLNVSIGEVARARNSGRECRGTRGANRLWSRLER